MQITRCVLAVALLLVVACKDPAQRKPIPPAATNRVTRAQMAIIDGNYSGALPAVEEAIRRAPHFGRAHFVRAEILTRLDRLDEARDAFEQVLAIDPAYPAIRFHLGSNAVQRGEYDEALDHYEAEASFVEHDTPMEHRLAVWMQVGNIHRQLGEIDEAQAAYDRALSEDSTFDHAFDALGQLYQEDGELDKALKARQRALDLKPENGGYAYHVGSLLFQLDRPDEAIPFLEKARQKLPWFEGSFYNLGRIRTAQGKTAEGERLLAAADSLRARQSELGMAKTNAEVHRTAVAWIIYADMLNADARYEEALQAYQAAAALDPSDSRPRSAIAAIRQRREAAL